MSEGFDSQIIFFHTDDLELVHRFYGGVLNLPLALDQDVCRIYRTSPSAYLGFCTTTSTEFSAVAMITMETGDVDGIAEKLIAAGAPCEKMPSPNPRFSIYNCFFRDPEGRMIEIQRFDDPGWDKSGR